MLPIKNYLVGKCVQGDQTFDHPLEHNGFGQVSHLSR